MEHCRTDAGRFRMRMRGADLGRVRVQANHVTSGYIARGEVRRDRYGLIFPTTVPSGVSRLNGFVPEPEDLVLVRPGAELLSHVRPGQGWAVVVLDSEAFAPLLAAGWPTGAGSALRRGAMRAAPGLRSAAMDIADLAASDPGRLGNPAVASAIVEAIATSLGAALGNPPERPGRAGRRCLRIVAAATEYLDAILGRPVYSDEVAEALGVSPRSLNEAFGAVLGMSLHRYLQTRRLNLAHRRLRAGEDGLVKTVALDLGFWHLGRFAISYRALFGETPAETLLQGRLRPR